jgi:hypothetical protein
MFGSELRGTNMLDGWMAADRATLANGLSATCERGAATRFVMEASADTTRRVQLEAILLPLMHAENAIERVIGALSSMASPHWLGHDHLSQRRLVSHELIWPDGRPNSPIAATASPQPAPPAAATSLRRSFRVVDGGRKED